MKSGFCFHACPIATVEDEIVVEESIPGHWLISRDMPSDSLQFGPQKTRQQLEDKVRLVLAGHVPAHTQVCHISSSAPVLKKRDRKFWRAAATFSTGTRGRPNYTASQNHSNVYLNNETTCKGLESSYEGVTQTKTPTICDRNNFN